MWMIKWIFSKKTMQLRPGHGVMKNVTSWEHWNICVNLLVDHTCSHILKIAYIHLYSSLWSSLRFNSRSSLGWHNFKKWLRQPAPRIPELDNGSFAEEIFQLFVVRWAHLMTFKSYCPRYPHHRKVCGSFSCPGGRYVLSIRHNEVRMGTEIQIRKSEQSNQICISARWTDDFDDRSAHSGNETAEAALFYSRWLY